MSLLVPVLPAIVALVLAAVAAQRIRHAPGGAVGRGLVTGAVALSTIGLLVWVGLAALLVGVTQHEEPTGRPAATASGTAGADQFSEVTAPPATEPPATEPPTTQPKVAAGRIGDKLTLDDGSSDTQLEVTVTRLKFSTGDQVDQPLHGLYMGAFVEVRALADDQLTPWGDLYALVGGHLYDGDAGTGLATFDPTLDLVMLNAGERASGWLVFDVPARHGQLVLRDSIDEHTLGAWTY
ncbi:MAG TPA: hypothetical protein VG276_09345 [Actinomycetes bacterium]|nr:hypothetical protein [Actinomycetes bacterium]